MPELRAPELKYFKLYLLILRLDISLPATLLAYLSSAVAFSSFTQPVSFAAASAVFFLISANMIVNDFINISYDKVRKPTKAILSRKVSLKMVGGIFWITMLLALATSYSINPLMTGIFLLITVIMSAYSWKAKNVIFSELIVGLLVALIIASAGIAGNTAFSVSMAVVYFFLSTSYVIQKNIKDFMQNLRREEETLIKKIGVFRSRFVFEIMTILMIASSFIPFITGVMGSVYLFFAIIADILMLVSIIYPKYALELAKASAFIIFIAFIFGSMEITFLVTIGV